MHCHKLSPNLRKQTKEVELANKAAAARLPTFDHNHACRMYTLLTPGEAGPSEQEPNEGGGDGSEQA